MAKTSTERGPVTNGGESALASQQPYIATAKIEGVADLLFHRWNVEAVAEKAAASKGSKLKKEDNIESYLYRDEKGILCASGEWFRMSIIAASKFRQDPRSPRKSAQDLYKAAIAVLTPLCSLGVKEPEYLHQCRAMIQRQGITRTRPAVRVGWTCDVTFLCNLPEYVSPNDLHEVLNQAGKLCGVGDHRPTYGRFLVKSFDIGTK